MRRAHIFVAIAAALAGAAKADDVLSIDGFGPLSASMTAGQAATVNAGDVMYWEDERKADLAVFLGSFEEGSRFWGNARAVGPETQLRRGKVNGAPSYCTEGVRMQMANSGIVCFTDADNDTKFELARVLIPHKILPSGDYDVSITLTDKLKEPVAYRTETAYGSVGGMRVVYRFRGVADGRVLISCKIEPKSPLPPKIQAVFDKTPGVLAEVVRKEAAAPSTVSQSLCLALDLLQVGKQQGPPFKIWAMTGDRMAKFEVTGASAGAISFRLVQPLSSWRLFSEPGADGALRVSVTHAARSMQ